MQVGVSMHDNSEGEIAGWAHSVEIVIEKVPGKSFSDFTLGDKCVVILC